MCDLSEMYYSRTHGMPFSWFSSSCMDKVILSVNLLHKVVPINFCLYVVCHSWLTRMSPGYLLLYQSYLLETSSKLKSFLLSLCSFYFPSSHAETNWTIRSSSVLGSRRHENLQVLHTDQHASKVGPPHSFSKRNMTSNFSNTNKG